MDAVRSRVVTAPLARRLSAHLDVPAASAWLVAFSLVFYLALSNGGYGTVVRSEVGIAVWWIVLIGAIVGLLPARAGPAGWTAIGLLGIFALWTGLSLEWTQSAERTSVELARVATYLGVLVLAIAAQGRTVARHTVNGLACAIGLITALAVLSRLHPAWFPANDHIEFLPGAERKLSYPLNYWNALAAFAAMGAPLLLALAAGARTIVGRALAAAALPLTGLCLYLTISRGGALALAVGLLAFLALAPARMALLSALAAAGAGAAILIAAASQREELQSGIPNAIAQQQGDDMIALAAIVCLGVGFVQVALSLVGRHVELPRALAPSRRMAALVGGVLLVFVGAVAITAGAPDEVSGRWDEFKAPQSERIASEAAVPGGASDLFQRLQGASGNGRYQYWQSAIDANEENSLTGFGPGTFEFWWSEHGTDPGFIRDAHTLYFETLAELGIVGLVLLGGLLAFLLVVAAVRCWRAAPGLRLCIAACTGALVTFMVSASVEWTWEMGAIGVAVMALAAVIVAGRGPEADPLEPVRPRVGVPQRAIVAGAAVAALVAIALPLSAATTVRDSRASAAGGNLPEALKQARSAQRVQPYAAGPHLQQALILERAGELDRAAGAIRMATSKESTNWRTWLVRARIDARRGEDRAGVAALRRARALNPRSNLFAGQ